MHLSGWTWHREIRLVLKSLYYSRPYWIQMGLMKWCRTFPAWRRTKWRQRGLKSAKFKKLYTWTVNLDLKNYEMLTMSKNAISFAPFCKDITLHVGWSPILVSKITKISNKKTHCFSTFTSNNWLELEEGQFGFYTDNDANTSTNFWFSHAIPKRITKCVNLT